MSKFRIIEMARDSVIARLTTTDILDAINECGLTDVNALLAGYKAGDKDAMGDAVLNMIESFIDDLADDEIPTMEAALAEEKALAMQARADERRDEERL